MANYYQFAYLDPEVTSDSQDLKPKENCTELAVLRIENQKPVRVGSIFRVAFLGSYVANPTEEWPLGPPTEPAMLRSLIQDGSRNFDGWLSVRANGLRLSVAGKATEFPLSSVQGCSSSWPSPAPLILEEGAGYITDHFPALFKLVTRKEAEDTVTCHLFLCQKRSDADALVDLANKQLERRMLVRSELSHLAVQCGIPCTLLAIS